MEYKQEENPYHILAYHETKRPIASREEDTNVTKLLNILVVTPNDMEKIIPSSKHTQLLQENRH